MSEKLTKQELEQLELGKKLQAFYDTGYVHKKQALSFSFLKGLATGFGAFLGGTLVVALVVWTVSRFNSVPLINRITKQVEQTLQKNN